MRETARRAFVASLVIGGVVVGALVLWKLRLLLALLFLAFIIAAAMRPGVEALRRRGVPRGLGITAVPRAMPIFSSTFFNPPFNPCFQQSRIRS